MRVEKKKKEGQCGMWSIRLRTLAVIVKLKFIKKRKRKRKM